MFACDDDEATLTCSAFNQIYKEDAGAQGPTLYVGWRKAVGDEDGGTFTITTGTTEGSCAYVIRITGAADPATQPPQVSAEASGSSVNPDSASLTPTGGSKDYLFISAEANDDDDDTTGWPSNMADNNIFSQQTTITLGIATEEVTNSVFDPAQFTIAASESWEAATIAVHPPGPLTVWTTVDAVLFGWWNGFEEGNFTAWDANGNSGLAGDSHQVQSVVKRTDTYAGEFIVGAAGRYAHARKAIAVDRDTIYIGCYVYLDALPTDGNRHVFMSLLDSGAADVGTVRIWNNGGTYTLEAYFQTVYFRTALASLSTQTWYYCELWASRHATTGALKVWWDTDVTPKIDQTNIDTDTGNPYRGIRVGNWYSSEACSIYIDDCAISSIKIGTFGAVQETEYFTADAHLVDRLSLTGTSADAHLVDRLLLTGTSADAHLVDRLTLTGTTVDAVLAGTAIFTADAHLVDRFTLTGTSADAHLVDRISLTGTTSDAHLVDRLSLTGTTSDAHLVDRLSVDTGADAHLVDRLTLTTTADAVLVRVVQTSADAHIVDRLSVDTGADAHLVDRISLTGTTADAHLILVPAVITSVDAHLVDRLTLTGASADAHLVDRLTLTGTSSDAHLVDRLALTGTSADAHLVDRLTLTGTSADAVLIGRVFLIGTTVDAVLAGTAQFTADAHLVDRINLTGATSDAHLVDRISVWTTGDAHLVARISLTGTTVDAHLIVGAETVTTSADAHLINRLTLTGSSADGHLVDRLTLTGTTADSHLVSRASVWMTVDAVIWRAAVELTLTSDAHLVDRLTVTSTVDAVLAGTTRTTADAHLVNRLTIWITSDAHLVSRQTITASADAILAGTVQMTVDAVLKLRQQIKITLLDIQERTISAAIAAIARERSITSSGVQERDITSSGVNERSITSSGVRERTITKGDMEMVYVGDTFEFPYTLADFDESAMTPDSQTVTLYDPDDGVVDTDVAPLVGDPGAYTAKLTVTDGLEAGTYTIVVKVTKTGEVKFEEFGIYVEPAP